MDSPNMTGKLTKRDKMMIAHATLGSVALLILSPTAILIARYFRKGRWLPIHVALNLVSVAMIIVTFATGVVVKGNFKLREEHHKMGTAIFVIAVVQLFIGIWAHFTRGNERQLSSEMRSRFETLRNKNPLRYFHMAIGLGLIGLGYAQVWSGIGLWPDESSNEVQVPKGVKVVYWLLMGLFVGLWAFGWVREAFLLDGTKMGRRRSSDFDDKTQLQAATATSSHS